MSTNVAESSLTVDGVVYVIDSGLEYEESYDPHTMSRCLSEEYVAASSMKQRRGRAGRTQPGFCYHLYTKEQADKFQKYPTPAIQKTDLTSDILDLMKLDYINNISDLKKFLDEFLSPPKQIFIKSSLNTLLSLECLTSIEDKGKVTDLGLAITKFRGIKPHLAKALIASYFYKCSRSVTKIISLLIISDGMINTLYMDFKPNKKKRESFNKKKEKLFKNSRKLFSQSEGDIMTLLNTYNLFKKEDDNLKKTIIDLHNHDNISIPDIIKKNSKRSVMSKRAGSKNKSLKFLKMLNVSNDILSKIKTTKDSDNSKELNEKQKNSIKKWCLDNYLHHKRITKVNKVSKLLNITLKKVIRLRNFNYQSFKKKKTIFKDDANDQLNSGKIEDVNQEITNSEEIIQEGGKKKRLLLEKYFNTKDVQTMEESKRIYLALLEGMFINIAVKNNNKYRPCFPIDKKDARINMDSFIKNPKKLVFYDELFMFNKKS